MRIIQVVLNLFFTCAAVAYTAAQADITHQLAISGTEQEALGIAQNGEGEYYYIFGSSASMGSSGNLSIPEHEGFYYMFLTKFDGENQLVWQKAYYGEESDFAAKMIMADDAIYLFGYSNSPASGNKTAERYGEEDLNDYWLIKLDFDGNILWDRTYGSTSNDVASDIILLNSGDLLMAGVSNGNASGVKSENAISESINDFWLVKVTSDGDVIWDKTIGTESIETDPKLYETHEGTLIVSGSTLGGISGNKSTESYGSLDAWIVSLDEEGEVLWDTSYGGNDMDLVSGISEINDLLYVIITSSSDVSGNRTLPRKGERDICIIKLDLLGDFQAEQCYGGNQYESSRELLVLDNEKIMVVASSRSTISYDKTDDNRGFDDYWPFVINEQGDVLWQATIGGTLPDNLISVLQRPNDKLLLVGTSMSGASADRTVTNHAAATYRDIWLVEIDASVLNTTETQLKLVNLEVYPNPFTETFTLKMDQPTRLQRLNNKSCE